MKHLVGKQQTKKVPFMGEEVEIRKLSISEVMELQALIKKNEKSKDPLQVLRDVLRMAVVDADQLSDADFNTFPPSDLNELSELILEYCGLGQKGQEAGN
jgi:hypothetical protein